MNRDLEQLLQELRSEGWLDSAGAFTLNAAKAREKLTQRQAREAGLWLVKLIQGAHLWQASSLHFRQKREQALASLRFGSQPLDLRPWLARVHEVEMMADPLYGPLATAFQAALADGCEFLMLQGTGLRLDEVGVHGPWQTLEPVDRLELAFHYLRQKPWWNPLLHLRPPRRSLENFLAASRKAGLALPLVSLDRYPISGSQGMLHRVVGNFPSPGRLERVWLSAAPARELMLYPPPQIRRAAVEEVAGRITQVMPSDQAYQALRQWRHEQADPLPLPDGRELQPWLDKLHSSGRNTPPPASQSEALAVRGLITWNTDSQIPSCILPVKYGIMLDAMPFTSLPTGVNIWLASSRWRTDINQKKVISDEVCRELCNWCLDQFDQMLAEVQAMLRWPERPQEALGHLKTCLSRQQQPLPSPKSSPYPG